MTTVALQPASSQFARLNVEKTLRKPIKLDYLKNYLSETDFAKLEEIYPEREARVWGVKFERVPHWAKLFPDNCLVLFRQSNRVVLRGIATFRTFNERLALYLWGPDVDGQPWSLVYFLKSVKSIDIPASEINKEAGLATDWNWQGFIAIHPPRALDVINLIKKHEGL